MENNRRRSLEELEKKLKIKFNNLDLLDTALTHSSFSNEATKEIQHNERLEFLGDSVVNFITTEILFKELKKVPEGDLTKYRASLICEASFAKAGRMLELPKYILLGKGEEINGGRERDSLIADAFEAFCGALYLDNGFSYTRDFILKSFKEYFLNSIKLSVNLDYKTILQEEFYKLFKDRIYYRLVRDEGPDHDKTFYYEVYSNDKVLGKGSGKSKKDAEHNAAKDALEKLGIINEE